MIEEEASLSGDCGITNETSGKVFFSSLLSNGGVLNYVGEGTGSLEVKSTAVIPEKCIIENDSKSYISLFDEMSDNSLLKKSGSGTGNFNLYGTVEGNAEFRNDSNNYMSIYSQQIPDGTFIKYLSKSKRGYFILGEFTHWVSGTEFTVEDISDNYINFSTWADNVEINTGKITLSGNGPSTFVLQGRFGGNLNIVDDGGAYSYLNVNKTDWNGETIRFRMNRGQPSGVDKRIALWTSNIGRYLDIESVPSLNLYGSYADNTKIRITGESNYGTITLKGNFEGTINVEMNGVPGSWLGLYQNIDDSSKVVFNSDHGGDLTINAGSVIDGIVTFNNHSNKMIYVLKGVTIHDGAVINVREDYPSNVSITEDIPAGATVNY